MCSSVEDGVLAAGIEGGVEGRRGASEAVAVDVEHDFTHHQRDHSETRLQCEDSVRRNGRTGFPDGRRSLRTDMATMEEGGRT